MQAKEHITPKEKLGAWLRHVNVPTKDPFLEEQLAEHLWGEGEDIVVVGDWLV